MNRFGIFIAALLLINFSISTVTAQPVGSIRGMVYDKDFDAPLASARITIAETGEKTTSTDEGNFVFGQVPPGKYTLIFSKSGYTRKVQTNVVVTPGKMTDVKASLSGEFTEMEEFVAQDLRIGGTEAGLLMLRIESPALLDSIGSELLSQSGASDAAGALKLISGATVQDGKFAVIRGLPDRYVNSQMNGVRLPTADPDKRSVQLDQFPTEVIESVQVSKTFIPDQQGDASGGAVNLVLKGIPDENVIKFKVGTQYNTNVTGESDFLSYKGGKSMAVSTESAPVDYKISFTAGGKGQLYDGIDVGAFVSTYYKLDSSYFDDGIDYSLWFDKRDPSNALTPQYGNPDGPPDPPIPAVGEDFKTSLFDITEGVEESQWGVLAALGAEMENHSINIALMHTSIHEDKAILAEDTSGKAYYFPNYNPNDPYHIGNAPGNLSAAPYLRSESLIRTERATDTLQFHGDHKFTIPEIGCKSYFNILYPEIDWTFAISSSAMDEPDKRQFGSVWTPQSYNPGNPIFGIPDKMNPAFFGPFTPAANILLGNLSQTWKFIEEDSDQIVINFKLPFKQWNEEEGYLKVGYFDDQVDRTYDQESVGNYRLPGDGPISTWQANWNDYSYAQQFLTLSGPSLKDGPPYIDVDYKGDQKISAWYYMVDFPLWTFVKLIAGVRYESTELSIINDPEEDAKWVTTDKDGNRLYVDLFPGDADMSYDQDDTLPSIGLVITPIDQIKIHGSYSETVARPTFKELTPIQQQEYLGGDIFIGNPGLVMSALENYDLRFDYTPYDGGLISASWFKKDIEDAIEYVQDMVNAFSFTTPMNYPDGELEGFEIEIRNKIGHFWRKAEGLTIGGNATFIDSEVTLPASEIKNLAGLGIATTTRDMLNAPEHLYNIFITYDHERTGTKIGLFYTVKGDTLVKGAGNRNGNYVPDIYATEHENLNLSISKKLWNNYKLSFKIKNITDPDIEEVYRSDIVSSDVVKTSYSKGVDFSLTFSGTW